MSTTDFLIVTALDEERDAVLRHFSMSPCPAAHEDIRFYYEGRILTRDCDYSLALVSLLGMGRVEAANATSDAIRRWFPRYVALVGIAGGIRAKEVALGDILVSDQVVDYELQNKRESGDDFRWRSYPVDPRLLGAARNLPSSIWRGAIAEPRPGDGNPNRHFGPIATGDKVVASEQFLAQLRGHYPALIGVEMEAGGAAAAAFQAAAKPGFFMVRAVSDLADPAKDSPDVKRWREYACDAAAGFLAALLGSSPVPPVHSNRGRSDGRSPVPRDLDPHDRSNVMAPVPVFRLRADGFEGGDDAALEHVIESLAIAKRSNHDCFSLVLPAAEENERRIAELKSVAERNDKEKAELVARIGSKKKNEEIHQSLRRAFRLVLQDATFRKSAGLGDHNPEDTWEILVHLRRQLFRQPPFEDQKVLYVSTTATDKLWGYVLLTHAEFSSENTRYLAYDFDGALTRRQGMFAKERYDLDMFTPSTIRRTCIPAIVLLLTETDDSSIPEAARDVKTWRLSIEEPRPRQ